MQTVSDTLLITLGCSWTYGVGVHYTPGMERKQYITQAWDSEICAKFSFRGLLAKQFGWDTLNFSHGGSSNQRQFRLLKEFLGSADAKQVKEKYKTIIVIHGITSTARNDMYFIREKQYINWSYGNQHPRESRVMLENFYDHDAEVESLQNEMMFFNSYYDSVGFNNIWFDTFNHHAYKKPIDHLLGCDSTNRDMLSRMCLHTGLSDFDNGYHDSIWKEDTNRVKYAVSQGYINPYSLHPTKRGQAFIAEIIGEELKKQLGPQLPKYFRS